MALLLSRKDVQNLLGMPDAIRIVEEAFKQLALGQVLMPQRSVIHVGAHGGVYLGMPAYIGGDLDALAIKIVSVYANNPAKHQLPTTIGTLLLNDPRTGAPLAVMDAGYLTAVRTGAVSGVATKYLARANAARVGVFGAGVQARTQLEGVCAVRKIRSAAVYDSDASRAREFAQEMSQRLGVSVAAVPEARAAVEGMDVILTASSAGQPIFDGAWLTPGQHINGVGSHSPKARELDTATIVRSKVVPDLPDACLAEAGDILIPLSEGAITKAHLYAGLGEIVAGLKPGRVNEHEITLFKSVGLALQDVATASFVYKKAIETRTGVEFTF